MINITFKPKTFELEINGHAGQNEKGEDIVCSAVSTLFYTLGQSLIDAENMLEQAVEFKDENGNGYLHCKPSKEYEANISLMWLTILKGFELVAINYSKYVNFVIEGEK